MANKVDELPLYQRAVEFCAAVTAILERPGLRKDRDLRDQISEASDSITANLDEGFEQGTDRAFANYVFIAKGSLGEVLGRLRTARRKNYITDADLSGREAAGDELGKMMGGFIRYLHESDFKDRGRFKLKQPSKPLATGGTRPATTVPESEAAES
jgi:four helix bundle protein